MARFDLNSLDLPSRVNVFNKVFEFVLLVVNEDSLVLESEAQLAVLETVGDVFCDPSFSELEVVWEEAFDSTDQDDKSKDLGINIAF